MKADVNAILLAVEDLGIWVGQIFGTEDKTRDKPELTADRIKSVFAQHNRRMERAQND